MTDGDSGNEGIEIMSTSDHPDYGAVILASDLPEFLNDVPEWGAEGSEIRRVFKWKDFAEAMTFVNAVAELAEAANHHPDIAIQWNKVTLSLSTHSKGGLTATDFELAQKIDLLARGL
jgi:4a-hydroxytetrahydrobiopterin dehydratase